MTKHEDSGSAFGFGSRLLELELELGPESIEEPEAVLE